METDGLVTVIIPVFNVRPYLSEALESVLHQTYGNLEIIVIDDGSTDGSREVCDEYAKIDSRVNVIRQENKGLSAARNVGLDIAKGDTIAFLDSDDAYHPDYVRTMIMAMCAENVDVVVSKTKVLDIDGNEIKRKKPRPAIEPGKYNREEILRALANGILNHSVWNKLYRRDLWKKIRFPEGRVFEEIETTYRILEQCKKVYVLNEPLYFYRIRPDSISHTCTQSNIKDWLLAWSHFETYVKDNIPDIFSAQDYDMVQRSGLRQLIRFFIRNNWENIQDPEFMKTLRMKILSIGQRVSISAYPFKVRTAYALIDHYPWLLNYAYPIYRWLKQVKRKLNYSL